MYTIKKFIGQQLEYKSVAFFSQEHVTYATDHHSTLDVESNWDDWEITEEGFRKKQPANLQFKPLSTYTHTMLITIINLQVVMEWSPYG